MPLPDMSRLVAVGLQHFRHGDLFPTQVHGAFRRTVTIHARTSRHAAGHEAHSSRRTIRRTRITLIKLDPFGSQSIDVRRDRATTIRTEIAVSHVVRQHDKNIGTTFGRSRGEQSREGKQRRAEQRLAQFKVIHNRVSVAHGELIQGQR